MSDEEIVLLLKKGKSKYIENLIDKYYKYLSVIIYNVGNKQFSNEDIEEMVSDCFLKFWLNIQRFDYHRENEGVGDMQVCITRIKNETLNGRWATSFSFSDSGESRIVKIKKKIELPEYSVDIQSVDINILGAQIKGTLLNKSNDIVTENFLLQVAFEDKQGKRIDLGTGSLEFSDGTFIMNCHSPEAVITDDIAKVILEGEEFDLK